MKSISAKHNNKQTIVEHQIQVIILLILSAIIYIACQFDSTMNFLAPTEEKLQDPKASSTISMIAILAERNSGTLHLVYHVIVQN